MSFIGGVGEIKGTRELAILGTPYRGLKIATECSA